MGLTRRPRLLTHMGPRFTTCQHAHGMLNTRHDFLYFPYRHGYLRKLPLSLSLSLSLSVQTRKGDYTQLHHTIAVLRELKVQYGNNAAAKMAEAFAVSLLRQVLINRNQYCIRIWRCLTHHDRNFSEAIPIHREQ